MPPAMDLISETFRRRLNPLKREERAKSEREGERARDREKRKKESVFALAT